MGKAAREKRERNKLAASPPTMPPHLPRGIRMDGGIAFLFGVGLGIFTWVASMIWHTLPRPILVILFIVSVCLMLAWPMAFIMGQVRPFLKAPYGLILMILGGGILGGIVFGSAWYFTEPNGEPQPEGAPEIRTV